MKKLKTILQYSAILIVLATIIICLYFINNQPESKYTLDNQIFIGTIQKITREDTKIQIILKAKENLLVNYYLEDGNFNYNLGDKIKIIGELQLPSSNNNFNLFNYRNYLLSQNIKYILNVSKIELIQENKNIFYNLKNNIINKIESEGNSSYLKAFILGDISNINEKVSDSYRKNGISHLFSVSGMHVGFLLSIFSLLLKKSNSYFKKVVIIILLFLFAFLVNFTPSVMRTILFMILLLINKRLKLNFKPLNLFIFLACLFLLYNPYFIYNSGFLYSFTISGFLIYYKNKISSTNYLINIFKISLLAFLVSFPITLYNSFELNLLSPLLNIVFVPLVTFVVFPFSFIVLLFPFLSSIYSITVTCLETLSIFFSNIHLFVLPMAKPTIFILFLYYIVIFLVLKNKKNLIVLLAFIFIHININKFNNNYNITTLDVGQGDSILVGFPYGGGNVLIDTGGSTYGNENYISNDITIPYLKSIGIHKLNYLILTHGDYDHMGEAINLVENFKVEKVIFNCGEFNELEQDLIKVLDKKKIPYYSCIKELTIDDNKLYFLNNKDYGNENDNSNVIYTELNNYKFLFMGDAGVEVEEDLIEKYNLQNIDVLKVGHHGSRTSSSELFIDEINSKYSIISVGKNNRYGHPNDNVLNNLDNSKIYRTDQHGSIMFKIKNDKLQIATCSP